MSLFLFYKSNKRNSVSTIELYTLEFCGSHGVVENVGLFGGWPLLIDRFDWTMSFQLLRNLLVLLTCICLLNFWSLLVTIKKLLSAKISVYLRCAELIKKKRRTSAAPVF